MSENWEMIRALHNSRPRAYYLLNKDDSQIMQCVATSQYTKGSPDKWWDMDKKIWLSTYPRYLR